MSEYIFRCRICSQTLFDEKAVVHPDESCFSTYKNCVGSSAKEKGQGDKVDQINSNPYESSVKNFYKVYSRRKSESDDSECEWEDVGQSPDMGDPNITDFTKDTSRKEIPRWQKSCTSIFVIAEDDERQNHSLFLTNLWGLISSAMRNGETSGVIDCPTCQTHNRMTRLGKFAICGAQCSCSKWITPAVQFVASKIDIRAICNPATM